MSSVTRLMPGYDPRWRERLAEAARRRDDLLSREPPLSEPEKAELLELGKVIDRAFNNRFRTTREYRDYYFARARELLENEGIDMPLPMVPDDARPEEVDRVLSLVWQAVEVTNSETF